jgi:sugar lactone lactonase YvrE
MAEPFTEGEIAPDLDELYITTSREGRGEREPQAGALFVSRPGIHGVPVHEYVG